MHPEFSATAWRRCNDVANVRCEEGVGYCVFSGKSKHMFLPTSNLVMRVMVVLERKPFI